MYCPSYEPPASSPQPNQGYSSLNRINLDMDMKNLFNTQDYYAGQGSDGNQEFYTGQYYSMVHGSAPGSTPLKTTLRLKRWQRPSKLRRFQNVAKRVIDYFEKETGSQSRGYDAIVSKWKNRVRSRIGAFCAIFDIVQRRNESGSCDLTVYQKVCVEYAAEYDHDFILEPCSVQGGLNLNDEADGSGIEVWEVRPIGRDQAKKKASFSSRSESSSVAGGG
ncbi:hypothetical protein Tco_0649981 [Tanacetum coccineum]